MANVLSNHCTYLPEGERLSLTLFFHIATIMTSLLLWNSAAADSAGFDRDRALQISQAAIGRTIGDYTLMTTDGNPISLRDYRGKPLLISMIFTSCHHICPTTTKHIAKSVHAAREVLGNDSFEIVSIGFDTANDTPQAMHAFARQQDIDAGNWRFLSTTQRVIEQLSNDLGFQFFASPRGYDHLNQLTVIDRDGAVYSQVYGINFELPWLVEPLKQLVFNRPESEGHPFSGLLDKVRLFCTVYNPATGRYEIDNSLFFQTAIGFIVVFSIGFYLLREARRARRN